MSCLWLVSLQIMTVVTFVSTVMAQEVMHAMKTSKSRDVAEARARAWTWHANMEDVELGLASITKVLNGAPLAIVGVSNGCVIAVELARRVEAKALWLASGVPAQVSVCSACPSATSE